jgi:hypothetical protein
LGDRDAEFDRVRKNRACLGGAKAHGWMDEHDPELWRHGDSIEVERVDGADQEYSAEQRGSDVVDVSPGESLLGGERRLEQIELAQRAAEERVRRDRTGDSRRRASALTAREGQAFRDAENNAAPRIAGATEDFGRGDRRGIASCLERKVMVSRALDANAGAVAEARFDSVAQARDGASEDVEAGAEVANPSRREGANARAPGGIRRGYIGRVTHA